MKRFSRALAGLLALWLAGCGGGGSGLTTTGSGSGGAATGPTADDFGRMTASPDTSSSTGAVRGVATEEDGSAAGNATVTVTGSGRQADEPAFSTLCDGSGQFAIGNMAPGQYQLQVSTEAGGETTQQIQVMAQHVTQVGALHLQLGAMQHGGMGGGGFGLHGNRPIPDAGAIVGHVFDVDGNPVARARLNIGDRLHAATGEQGGFAFGPLPEGTYAVVCRAQGHIGAEQDAEVLAGEATELTFQLEAGDDGTPTVEPAVVKGVVVDAATDDPVVGAEVVLAVGRALVRTDENGLFEFDQVRPGRLLLGVRADGYLPWRDLIPVRPGAEVALRIRLAPVSTDPGTGNVGVLVVDKVSGDPIAGAPVVIDGLPPFFTNDAGRVLIEGVPVGWHYVFAGARGHERARDVVRVTADETVSVTLELQPVTDGPPS